MPKSEGSETEEYEVDKILDTKIRRRRRYYLVRWKGFDAAEDSWEPATNLLHCKDLVKEFEVQASVKKSNKTSSKLPSSAEKETEEISESETASEISETNSIKKQKSNQIKNETRENTPKVTEVHLKESAILSPGYFKEIYGRYPDINEIKQNVKRRSIARIKGETTPELIISAKKNDENNALKCEHWRFLILYILVAIFAVGAIFYLTDRFQMISERTEKP